MKFEPTDVAPGSIEKIELLRKRADLGFPLFHSCDRKDCDGMVGGTLGTTKTRRAEMRRRGAAKDDFELDSEVGED